MEEFGNPEKPKVSNLSDKRLEKQSKVNVSPGGYFLYPEDMVEITVDEALEVADDVVEKYSKPRALYDDFFNKEALRLYGSDLSAPLNLYSKKTSDEITAEMEASLSSQKKYIESTTTEGLIKILAFHKKNPLNYYGTVIFTVAEELKKRFNKT